MNFYQIIILIIIFVISIIVIRISFKFDFNRHFENRRKIKLGQLKNICPHGRLTKINDQFAFESFFVSPAGTMDYICSQCSAVVGKEQISRINEKYIQNPTLIFKKQKEFMKKAKKLKII